MFLINAPTISLTPESFKSPLHQCITYGLKDSLIPEINLPPKLVNVLYCPKHKTDNGRSSARTLSLPCAQSLVSLLLSHFHFSLPSVLEFWGFHLRNSQGCISVWDNIPWRFCRHGLSSCLTCYQPPFNACLKSSVLLFHSYYYLHSYASLKDASKSQRQLHTLIHSATTAKNVSLCLSFPLTYL